MSQSLYLQVCSQVISSSFIFFQSQTTCQEKLQGCHLPNVKEIAEDEGLRQKLLGKEPRPLLTLDGDAFCAGFAYLLFLVCTFWLRKNEKTKTKRKGVLELTLGFFI